jgi:hypothetical protein
MNEPGHAYRDFIGEVGTTFRINAAFGVCVTLNWKLSCLHLKFVIQAPDVVRNG